MAYGGPQVTFSMRMDRARKHRLKQFPVSSSNANSRFYATLSTVAPARYGDFAQLRKRANGQIRVKQKARFLVMVFTPIRPNQPSRFPLVGLLILSGLIISICMGLRQSLGLFMRPMVLDLGISAATFGFSIALQNIIWGLSQPLLGSLADRYGPRPVLVGTALVYAAGLVLMVFARNITGGLEVAGFLAGIGIAGTGFGVLIGTVSKAVEAERRSKIVGLVAAAGSLGTMAIAPLGQWMIDTHGWKAGMVVFACLAAALAILALPIRDSAGAKVASSSAGPGFTRVVAEALRHRGFLFMTLAFFACGFQLVFVATYLPSYLQICGVAPGVAASALGLIGVCNAIGTYGFGLLGSRYSQKHLLAYIYLCRTIVIGIFLAVPISAASTMVFAAAMGLLWLGVIPLVGGIVGRVFGLQRFNTLYGLVFLSHQLGSFCGAWMGGAVFDHYHKFDVAWVALLSIGLLAFTLQWFMDENPPHKLAKTSLAAA